ncbi:acyl-CoA carboxylase subunit beta [bacterium]|nr:acyl-CoA carboxylase subunit beta [bacterium]
MDARLEFARNEDQMRLMLSEMKRRIDIARDGGGLELQKRQKALGKMTVRERVAHILDPDRPQLEIGALAGEGLYAEHGGCPAGGVVVVLGYVQGKMVLIVANDATVKAGTWFPITAKKNLRAQELALENRIPIVYLVDSAGVYLPLQDEVFPDKENFGRIFRNNALLSSKGITQIAAIMGSCVAGGAYLPIMSDEALIVDKTGSIFLAGSYLVKAAIGEDIDNETLGGATTHCEISGVTDYKAANDADALNTIRGIVDKIGHFPKAGFDRIEPLAPSRPGTDIHGLFPNDRSKPYDTFEIVQCIADRDSIQLYKKDFGKSILTAYARIDGWAVGIVANNRQLVRNGKGETQFGGVIYSDSADKAARFIANCNQKHIPLVFLQDVTGFMVGSRSEHGGIIKDGAKMVNAVSNSVVPKFTVLMGNAFGAGYYAMCGKAYDPRLIVAWPSARLAVMGGTQAAEVLLQIEKGQRKSKSRKEHDPADVELYERIRERYDEQTSPYYAAARLWVDAMIDPADTRQWLSMGIEMANHNPEIPPFSMGLLQT